MKKNLKILIIAHGVIVENIFESVLYLNKKNIFPTIYCNPNLTNISRKDVIKILSKYKKIFFIEEHFLKGGLASHFFEKSLEYKINFDTKKIVSINPKFEFLRGLGERKNALTKVGLNKKKIISRIISNLN